MTQGNNRFKIKYERNMNVNLFTNSTNLDQILFSNLRRTPSSLTRIANFDNRIEANYNTQFSMFRQKNMKYKNINQKNIKLNGIKKENINIPLITEPQIEEELETITEEAKEEIEEANAEIENVNIEPNTESNNVNEDNITEFIESQTYMENNEPKIIELSDIFSQIETDNDNLQKTNVENPIDYSYQYGSDSSSNSDDEENDFINDSWNEDNKENE